MIRRPPRSTLFPYTTLFRSSLCRVRRHFAGDQVIGEGLERPPVRLERQGAPLDRKSTRLNSSHSQISYAVFCLKKKKKITNHHDRNTHPYVHQYTYHHNVT